MERSAAFRSTGGRATALGPTTTKDGYVMKLLSRMRPSARSAGRLGARVALAAVTEGEGEPFAWGWAL